MNTTTIPSTTTRVVLPGLVDPAGLKFETQPMPQPGAGQLLVAVQATGVSFAEQAMRRGRYPGQPRFPFTPGYDMVGVVLAAGSPADEVLVGKRVATITKTGSWATHLVVKARDSIVVPDAISSADAETVVVNGVTAWQMLHRTAAVRSGQTVLLFGANSGVGGILIQLAQHAGITVIGAASPRHHDALRARGVIPVDYNDPELAAKVRAIAPAGVAAVFDNIGGEVTRMSWKLLARGGALVTFSIISVASGSGNLIAAFLRNIAQGLLWSALPNGKKAGFYNIWAGHLTRPARYRRYLEEDLGHVFNLLAAGTITPNIAAEFPLTDVVAAMTLAESRTLSGKVILLP